MRAVGESRRAGSVVGRVGGCGGAGRSENGQAGGLARGLDRLRDDVRAHDMQAFAGGNVDVCGFFSPCALVHLTTLGTSEEEIRRKEDK